MQDSITEILDFLKKKDYQKDIKMKLLKCDFPAQYIFKHMNYLSIYNPYAFIVYVDNFLNEISDEDIENGSESPTRYKQFLIDACDIINKQGEYKIDVDRIINRFSKVFGYDDDWNEEYEWEEYYDVYRESILKNNIDTINYKRFNI